MLIIGDKLVPFSAITKVTNTDEIKNTKANSIVSFGYNEELLKYCSENSVESAVIVDSIKEAIYCNALNSSYIIASKALANKIQKVAENYMFDSKVLAIIESDDEIEEIALLEIDGVIYSSIL